jgi:hypothetical protein
VAVTALRYGAMRMHWCRLALWAFAKRWAVYIVVAAAVLSAGAVGFLTIVMAAAAWLVLPLFYAASQGLWLLPAVLAQALFGVAAVWGMRHVLWPPAWGEAERALPIAASDKWRSDVQVVLMALLPLLLLYAAGAAALLGQKPDWLRAVRGRAVLALCLACVASLMMGASLLQHLRLPPRARATRVVDTAVASPARRARGLQWAVALLWWPLWRGPARRTGQALWVGSLLLWLPALAITFTHLGMAWWLAGLALLALLVATRINHLAREELLPLLQASTMLPLRLHVAERLRASLGVWPVVLALLLTTATLTFEAGWRPIVWAAFVIAVVTSVVVEVVTPPAAPDAKAARWLFSLVLCVCLASEVMA